MSVVVLAHQAPSAAERFKDASAVAFVALLLGIPMIGLTTVDQGGALQVASRWPTLLEPWIDEAEGRIWFLHEATRQA